MDTNGFALPHVRRILTLAQTAGAQLLLCLDGLKMVVEIRFIQRLKDKLGNWSNASAEIEYHDTEAI